MKPELPLILLFYVNLNSSLHKNSFDKKRNLLVDHLLYLHRHGFKKQML